MSLVHVVQKVRTEDKSKAIAISLTLQYLVCNLAYTRKAFHAKQKFMLTRPHRCFLPSRGPVWDGLQLAPACHLPAALYHKVFQLGKIRAGVGFQTLSEPLWLLQSQC